MTTTVAARVDRALQTYSGSKTQTEIAQAIGFNSPGMLSMIKTGKAKLPLKRVPALSRELSIPVEELLLLVLDQDYPDQQANPLWIAFGGRRPLLSELLALRKAG